MIQKARGTSGFRLLDTLEDLYEYTHNATMLFPKSERHVLAAQIRNTNIELIRLVIAAARKYYKKTTLQEMDIELDVMRVLVRTSYNMRYINGHKYEVWTGKIRDVGNMLGKWLNTLRSQTGEQAPCK